MRIWEQFLDRVSLEIGKEPTDKWLRTLIIRHFDAGNLYLEARDSFQMLWFEEHMRAKVDRQLWNQNRRPIKVHISIPQEEGAVKEDDKDDVAAEGKAKKGKEAELKFELRFDELDPSMRIEQFVPSKASELAYKIVCEMTGYLPHIQKFSDPTLELGTFNPVFIHGPAGSGKTHLLHGLGHQFKSMGLKVLYTRAQSFTEHVVSAIRCGEMRKFREVYRNIDVLLLDDVQVFSRKNATQEELHHTFNALHLDGKQMVMTGNIPPSEMEFIEPRLISRFEWGICLGIDSLEGDELRDMIFRKAMSYDFPMDDKLASYLIEQFTSSPKAVARALEALVLRTHLSRSKGHLSNAVMDDGVAKHFLADLISEEKQTEITPTKIVSAVANQFGIRVEDLLGKSQRQEYAQPRKVAMYLCRNQLGLPYTRIGEIFKRDHSTVMTSVKQVEEEEQDAQSKISQQLTQIIKKVRA
jgi:chromosomal replication initiator protein